MIPGSQGASCPHSSRERSRVRTKTRPRKGSCRPLTRALGVVRPSPAAQTRVSRCSSSPGTRTGSGLASGLARRGREPRVPGRGRTPAPAGQAGAPAPAPRPRARIGLYSVSKTAPPSRQGPRRVYTPQEYRPTWGSVPFKRACVRVVRVRVLRARVSVRARARGHETGQPPGVRRLKSERSAGDGKGRWGGAGTKGDEARPQITSPVCL